MTAGGRGEQADRAESAPVLRFYGRRQGRRLRTGQRARVEQLLPECTLSLDGEGAALDPAALFGQARAVWLEIGFGGGEHLAWQAARHPEIGLIGCEPFLNGVVSALGHIQDQALGNVRIWPDDARRLLPALPDAAIERGFLLFPDPWPKARHHKRRLVAEDLLDQLARVLKPGALLRMASDDVAYVRVMLEVVRAHPAFVWTARCAGDWRERPADWPATRYEQKARQAGRSPVFLTFQRCC